MTITMTFAIMPIVCHLSSCGSGSRREAARGSSNTSWAVSKPSLYFRLLARLLLSSHIQRKEGNL